MVIKPAATAPSAALEAMIASDDLAHCIASCLPSRAALRSLCLVSRWWNQAFSQYLFSHIAFHDGNSHILRDPELLNVFISNPRLARTKVLSFRLIEGSWAISTPRALGRLVDPPCFGRAGCLGDFRHWAGVYNDSMRKIALNTPALYRFEWENWPISQSLLAVLEEYCPSLRDVAIVYPNLTKFAKTESLYRPAASTLDDVKPPQIVPFSMPQFQNLRQLYLYEITGDLDIWVRKISTMLGKSRLLERLGLSLSAECERQYALAGKSRAFLNFFRLLAERYRDQGDDPLRLRVLKLGYGVLLKTTHGPRPGDSLEQAEYLSYLVDPVTLEELYIDNDLDNGWPLHIWPAARQVSWPTVTPSFLPNLKRFTFTSLSQRSREWLAAHPDPTFVNSLAMGIGVERFTYSHVDDEGVVRKEQGPRLTSRDIIHFLVGSEEYPNPPLKSSTLQILKPCHQCDLRPLSACTWIKTLVVCLEKRHGAYGFESMMEVLPKTEHLWIRIGMDYPLVNPRDEDSHRANAFRFRDGSVVDEQLHNHRCWRARWAEMALAVSKTATCPTRYLKIGHLAWRVAGQGEGGEAAVLEPMDRWDDEAEGPEVFRYNDPVRRDRPY